MLMYVLIGLAASGWGTALVLALFSNTKMADLEASTMAEVERWKRELVKCYRWPRRVEKIKKAWANIQYSPTLTPETMSAIGLTPEVVYALEYLKARPKLSSRQRPAEPAGLYPEQVQKLRQKIRIDRLEAMIGNETEVHLPATQTMPSVPPVTLGESVAVVAGCRSGDCDREVQQ